MFKLIKYFSCLIPVFLILSCFSIQKKQIEIIDVESNIDNQKRINLSEFTNDCRYVLPEQKDGTGLQGVFRYDFTDSLMFISDLRNCYLYDINGRYISKIGDKGRGPGEFSTITDIRIGKKNRVYIQSLFDLNVYDINGSYFGKYKNLFLYESDYVSNWIPLSDSLIFGKVSRMTGKEKYKAVIYNFNGEVKEYFKNYIFLTRKKPLAGIDESYANIYSFKNSIYFKEWCNDTLFNFNNKFQLIPLYCFRLGKYSQKYLQGDEDLQEYILKLKNYIWIENVFQTEDFLILDCDFNKYFPVKRLTTKEILKGISTEYNTTHLLGVFNKKTNVLVFITPSETDNPLFTSGFYNDIDGGPRFFPIKMVNDSTMVMSVNVTDIKQHVASDDFGNCIPKYPEKKKQFEEFVNKLIETDNPVMMFVTFKKSISKM